MAAVPYHVVHAFMQGRADRAGQFYSTGDALYSYGLKIVESDPEGGVRITLPDGYEASATTNVHLHACAGLRERSGREIVKIAPGRWGVRVLDNTAMGTVRYA